MPQLGHAGNAEARAIVAHPVAEQHLEDIARQGTEHDGPGGAQPKCEADGGRHAEQSRKEPEAEQPVELEFLLEHHHADVLQPLEGDTQAHHQADVDHLGGDFEPSNNAKRDDDPERFVLVIRLAF